MTERQRYLKRLNALRTERSTWDAHWRELADYILPWRQRFFTTDANRGTRRNQSIINNTATRAARVLSSGMMAGITSPARPWFRLTTPDPDVAEFGAVRRWLHVVEQRILEAFARSNIYNGLHSVYEDLGVMGVSALHVEEDPEDVLRSYVFPVGSYCLAQSGRQRVDTIFREYRMTVSQVMGSFPRERISARVRNLYDSGNYDEWVDVLLVIEPRRDVRPDRLGPESMPWRSCWIERDAPEGAPPLREGGYREFPVMAPRWATTGEDVYGSSPGMECLGDAKALQVLERRKGQLVDKLVNPPIQAPASLGQQAVSLLPGDWTYVDIQGAHQRVGPIHEVHPQAVAVSAAEIREHEERINASFFADLWLMLARSDGKMTATEVAERKEEKLLQLGPVMERLADELLDPLIDRAFGILMRGGLLPPPPEELEGVELRVEYMNIMSQAQKMLGAGSVERFVAFAGNLAAVRPDILDKVNLDQAVEEYGTMLAVPPDLIRTEEEVEALRQQRIAQEEEAAAAQVAKETVQGAKVLSETDVTADNALTRMLSNMVPGAQA